MERAHERPELRARVFISAIEPAGRQTARLGPHRDSRTILHADGHALPARRSRNDGYLYRRAEVRRRIVRSLPAKVTPGTHRSVSFAPGVCLNRRIHRSGIAAGL